MQKKTLFIPKISCGHCVMTIKNELSEIEGIGRVEGDPAAKTIKVSWDAPATLEKIKTVLADLNYPVEKEE